MAIWLHALDPHSPDPDVTLHGCHDLKVRTFLLTVPDGIAPISDELIKLIQLMVLPSREVVENTTVPLQELPMILHSVIFKQVIFND